MNWLFWLLVAWFAANAIGMVATVGKPRKPISSPSMATAVAASPGVILLLVLGWPR